MADLLPVERALSIVLDAAPILPFEQVQADDALGRWLQEEIHADHDYPEFDKSLMDGYAVVAADLQRDLRPLRVNQEIPAGIDPARLVAVVPGTAARIMTGAPIPPGADAVLIVEESEPVPGDPDVIRPKSGVSPGASDLILDLGSALHTEICRPLAGSVFKPVEDVRGEDGAFDADARVVHGTLLNAACRPAAGCARGSSRHRAGTFGRERSGRSPGAPGTPGLAGVRVYAWSSSLGVALARRRKGMKNVCRASRLVLEHRGPAPVPCREKSHDDCIL